MKRDGGSIFENVIARRIVVLAKLGNEFNHMKLEKKRNYIFWERIRLWLWILMYTGMSTVLMIILSLFPFIVGGLVVLVMSMVTAPFSSCVLIITNQDMDRCHRRYIDYTEVISGATHRMICSIWQALELDAPSGRYWHLFGYWKWVCYILVGNTCNQN